jgi:hypothetical protein
VVTVPVYEYACDEHGTFVSTIRADDCFCPRGAHKGRRVWSSVHLNTKMPGSYEGWNPVVGQYVRNEAEFDTALARHKEAEFASTGVEPVWTKVDVRDTEARNELHGMTESDRQADLAPTHRHLRDKVH